MNEYTRNLIEENLRTKEPFLDLGNCNLYEFPIEVFKLTHLRGLNLASEYTDPETMEKVKSKNRLRQNEGVNLPNPWIKEEWAPFANYLEQLIVSDGVEPFNPRLFFSALTFFAVDSPENIGFLSFCSKLIYLKISGRSIKSLEPLVGITQIQHLEIIDTSVSNLWPIVPSVNMRVLEFSGDQLSDLSPLSTLKSLQYLKISGDQIKSIVFLNGLENIRHLEIYSSSVSSLEPIKFLRNIETLYLMGMMISDLSPIKELNNIQELKIMGSTIKELSPLRSLTRIVNLVIDSDLIYDIIDLCGLNRIKVLELYGDGITNLEPITKLTSLECLTLDGDHIIDIRPIVLLKRLVYLKISSFLLADLEPISQLKEIRQLSISGNRISNLAPISSLENLSVLKISGPAIFDLLPLHSLWTVQHLEIINTSVSDLTPIKFLQNIDKLVLSGDNILNLEPLVHLKKIKYLEIRNSNVSSITPLIGLKKIEDLILYGNKIIDLEPIKELTAVKQLTVSAEDIKSLMPISNIFLEGYPTTIRISSCEDVPSEILRSGYRAIQSFLREKVATKKEDRIIGKRSARILIIGDGEVGKTHLMKHICRNRDEFPEIESTHGMQIVPWVFNDPSGNQIEIKFIDFGGQEYYHESHHLFFNDRTGYILLWEKSENDRLQYSQIPKTFISFPDDKDESKNPASGSSHPLEYWLDAILHFSYRRKKNAAGFDSAIQDVLIKGLSPNGFNPEIADVLPELIDDRTLPKLVELYSREGFNEKKLKSALSGFLDVNARKHLEENIDASKLTQEWKSLITSRVHTLVVQNKIAKHGVAFLDQKKLRHKFPFIDEFAAVSIKENYRTEILDKTLIPELLSRISTQEWLGSWEKLLEQFKGLSEYVILFSKIENMHRQIFKENAEENEMFDPNYTENFINAMEDAGEVIDLDKNLINEQRMIIIKPVQVVNGFYIVLNRDELENSKGVFSKTEAIKWVSHDASQTMTKVEVEYMLGLMCDYQIIFKFPEESESFVAPQYLPAEEPAGVSFIKKITKVSTRKIQYEGYMHRHVIQEFFSKFGKHVHHEGKNKNYMWWKNGIVISKKPQEGNHEERMVLVEFIKENQSILIYPQDGNPQCLLVKEILGAFEEMNEGRSVSEMVSLDGSFFVPVDDLIDAAEKGLQYFSFNDKQIRTRDYSSFLPTNIGLPKKVFLSYRSSDRDFVEQFKLHLLPYEQSGEIEIWYDRQMKHGDDWNDEIEKHLKESEVVLFFLSPDFFSSSYLEKERDIALELKANEKADIIPFIIEPCSWEKYDWIARINNTFGKDTLRSGDKTTQSGQIVKAIQSIEYAFARKAKE